MSKDVTAKKKVIEVLMSLKIGKEFLGGALAPSTKDLRVLNDVIFLNTARFIATGGSCLRRNYGALLVSRQGVIVGEGRTTHVIPNTRCDFCVREYSNIGEDYALCPTTHAEISALLSIVSTPKRELFSAYVLFLVGVQTGSDTLVPMAKPCRACVNALVSVGVQYIRVLEGFFHISYFLDFPQLVYK